MTNQMIHFFIDSEMVNIFSDSHCAELFFHYYVFLLCLKNHYVSIWFLLGFADPYLCTAKCTQLGIQHFHKCR
jgi:hypothetical protein